MRQKAAASRNSKWVPGDKLLVGMGRHQGLGSASDHRYRKKIAVVNEHKEVFMTTPDGRQNFAAMLDTQLPEEVERHIRDCLVVKPVQFSSETAVREQCIANWKRDINDLMFP